MHRCDHRLHPATNIEVADNPHPLRLGARHEIVQNSVDCTLVKDAVIPVTPQIVLEALELYALCRRDVSDANRPEVGRASLQQRQLFRVALDPTERTKGCELRAIHVDLVVTVCVRIVEGLEKLWSWHPRTMHR